MASDVKQSVVEVKQGQRVQRIECKEAVHFGGHVSSTVDADMGSAILTLHTLGVIVEFKGKVVLVPYANLRGIIIHDPTMAQKRAAAVAG